MGIVMDHNSASTADLLERARAGESLKNPPRTRIRQSLRIG